MRHRDESLGWMYRLGWLVPEQLACLYRPSGKVVVGRGYVEGPSTYSEATARRAIRDLEDLGLARAVQTIPPWRESGRGRPPKAYCLTRPGIEAGALVAGEPPGESKNRGKYMRSMVSKGRINHALLRNEFGASVADECFARGLVLADFWGEGGARLSSGPHAVEPDGVLELENDDGSWRRRVYVEADMHSQKRAHLQGKMEKYAQVLIDLTDFGRALGRGGSTEAELPTVVFLSRTGRRSRRVREWLEGAAHRTKAHEIAEERGVNLNDVFLVSNLEWLYERGALAEDACLTVGTREWCSPLDEHWRPA